MGGELGGHRGTSRRGFDAGEREEKWRAGRAAIDRADGSSIYLHASVMQSLGKLAPPRRGLLFCPPRPATDPPDAFWGHLQQEPQA